MCRLAGSAPGNGRASSAAVSCAAVRSLKSQEAGGFDQGYERMPQRAVIIDDQDAFLGRLHDAHRHKILRSA